MRGLFGYDLCWLVDGCLGWLVFASGLFGLMCFGLVLVGFVWCLCFVACYLSWFLLDLIQLLGL